MTTVTIHSRGLLIETILSGYKFNQQIRMSNCSPELIFSCITH